MQSKLGMSLIEIMISLLLLSMLLLGLDAMQITVLKYVKNTYLFSVATQQVKQMAERLTAAQEKNSDEQIIHWNQQNAEVLPHGRGMVEGYYPSYHITLFWGGSQDHTCDQNKIGRTGCLQLTVHC